MGAFDKYHVSSARKRLHQYAAAPSSSSQVASAAARQQSASRLLHAFHPVYCRRCIAMARGRLLARKTVHSAAGVSASEQQADANAVCLHSSGA
jgi:hypothetical protein